MPSVPLCWQRWLWGPSAAKPLKRIKVGWRNCRPTRRMYTLHVRGNRCLFGRCVSPLLVLLTSLTFPLFISYLLLLISLSKQPVHVSRWLPFWLISPPRRCSESRFNWKYPGIPLNIRHCRGYFRFQCGTSTIAQIIFLLENAPCDCTSLTGIITQASSSPPNYIILTQNFGY